MAETTREAVQAERCSLFHLEGRQLMPAVAIATYTNEALWNAFKQIGPIEMNATQYKLFNKGSVVALEDVNQSDLIPQKWIEQFCLGSVVFVPLPAAGKLCGLMIVDWSRPRLFKEEELHLLETIGSYAGMAVRNAQMFEDYRHRARVQEALARAAGGLASHLEPRLLAERLVDAYADVLGARLCTIGMLDQERTMVRAFASRSMAPIPRPLPLSEIPAEIVNRLWMEWAVDKHPIRFDDHPWFAEFVGGSKAGVNWYLAIPLVAEGHTRGIVLLGFDQRTRLSDEEVSAAEALAAIAGAALERSILLERLSGQFDQLHALYRLSTALSEDLNATALVEEINHLLGGQGIKVVGMAFRNRDLAQRLGVCEPPNSNGKRPGKARSGAGVIALPMYLERRAVGTLWVQPANLDSEQQSFLEALGRGVAEVATRAALRAGAEEASRQRAVGAERERIAADLHDTAGQIFVAVGLLSRRLYEELPKDSPWCERILRFIELADHGKWEIDNSIRALAFVPTARRPLTTSIRELANSFQADSGISTLFAVDGKAVRLGSGVERAIYRVTHEALANAWRHSRCSLVSVKLSFSAKDICLHVRDDGVGLLQKGQNDASRRMGLVNMRRTMEEVGGSLRVRDAKPRGVCVEARAPRRPRG